MAAESSPKGPLKAILANPRLADRRIISPGRKQIPIPEQRRNGNGKALTVVGARANNLKDLDVEHPARQAGVHHRRLRLAANRR